MEYRTAGLNDVEQISMLYQEFFTYNAAQQPLYYRPAIEGGGYPKHIIANEQEELFIAVENDKAIGLLHIAQAQTPPHDCFVPYKFANVVDLYIQPGYRGKSVGAELMNLAKYWAENRGLDYLELNVLAENENAVRFYEREGFQAVSHIMRINLSI